MPRGSTDWQLHNARPRPSSSAVGDTHQSDIKLRPHVLDEFARAKMLLDRLIEHNPEVAGFLIQHARALFELDEIQRAKAEPALDLAYWCWQEDHRKSRCGRPILGSNPRADWQNRPPAAGRHVLKGD